MKILYLHGLEGTPHGRKAEALRAAGHEVHAPELPRDDFPRSVEIARTTLAATRPELIVGSSRGGAVALELAKHCEVPIILLAPAWRRFGVSPRLRPPALILHGIRDTIVPLNDSLHLQQTNQLPAECLVPVNDDHRLGSEVGLTVLKRLVAELGERSQCLVRDLFSGPLDLIGDVHARTEPLHQLLERLGYQDGQHREGRRLVFVGDLVDRGPDSVATVELVQRLVERGVAQCVLGNHELNLLRGRPRDANHWFFGGEEPEDSQHHGRPVRLATTTERVRLTAFFRTLPLALERPDLRVVHACWQPEMIEKVRTARDVLEIHHLYRGQIEDELDNRREEDPLASELALQNRNPVKVLTSGLEQPCQGRVLVEGRAKKLERAPWWDSYCAESTCVFGHYHRGAHSRQFEGYALEHALGPKGTALCIDCDLGLGALRWPERELVFANGTRILVVMR